MNINNLPNRKIIHVDMDCFYASVEIRDHPEYRNKPVAVAGSSENRGVVTTCNYIARKYGGNGHPLAAGYTISYN